MLVAQVAAVRDSVVLVIRVCKGQTEDQMVLRPEGTAFCIGNDLFLTAAHLFADPPLAPSDEVSLVSVGATPSQIKAVVEFRDPARDLAILRSAADAKSSMKPLSVSVGIEPDGRSVFSYGFIKPRFETSPKGPMLFAAPHASLFIIGGRVPFFGNRYELDGHTYPGESGAPVFRASDSVVIGVVQATRPVEVPAPINTTRGPTIASPLDVIKAELIARGVGPVP
jgi:Trypsin-like peptidase domain